MKKKKILIIDDEKLITTTLKRLLQQSGYEPVTVNTGPEAIERVEKESFDLIISDIRMPGLDGIQTLKEIKEELKRRNRTSPVVFITGYADQGLEQQAKSVGFDDYIYKPFDLKAFLQRIQKVLDQSTQVM